jgi:beta-lactamase class D
MKKKNKINSYLKIIKQIEKVRAKNNKNWMDLYRLAFKIAPDESVKIIKKILSKDMTVSNLAKKLIK